jgi:hypothetical protein
MLCFSRLFSADELAPLHLSLKPIKLFRYEKVYFLAS